MNKEQHSGSAFYGFLLAGLTFFVLFNFKAAAQTYYSRDNNTGVSFCLTSWDGPMPASVYSTASDYQLTSGTVVVNGYLIHGLTGSPSNVSFTNTGTSLIVQDTIRIVGDLSMFNSASIHIKPEGVLIVHGNYLQDANVSFINEGNAVFLGNWTSADFPSNTSSSGNLYVAGAFSATGSSIIPKTYAQLQTDNPSLYAFSKNAPVASVCASSNSGSVTLTEPYNSISRWESSTDFFRNQVTQINATTVTLPYGNLRETLSYRAYYKKSTGGFAYSNASTVVVRNILEGEDNVAALIQIPATDLAASFHLDGNATDVSGNGNIGSLMGGPVAAENRFNINAKALSFDGVDDYISTTTLFPAPGPQLFSISLWFKTTTTTGGKLIGFGDQQTGESDKRDRHLYMTNTGQLYFGVYPESNLYTVNTSESYNDGLWHHALVSLSAAGMELYVDGALKAREPNVTSAQNYAGYWRIGYDFLNSWPSQPASRFYSGNLDDIYIFNKRLTATEVEELYQAGAAPVCEGESVMLMATTVQGATYSWSGPNGFVSTLQNPVINGVSAVSEGKYTVSISYDGCTASGSADLVVTPAAQGGNITASQNSVCTGTNSVRLTLENYVGSVVRWEKSIDDFVTDISPIAHTAAELAITNLSEETSYRAVVSSGSCGTAISLPFTIEIDTPATGGTISGTSIVCMGENSGSLTLSGHTGTILRWESSTDNFESDITPIASTAPSLSFQDLLQTTSFRAVVKNGSCGEVFSTAAEVIVDAPSVGGSLDGSTVICAGNNSGALSLSGHVGEVLRWESAADPEFLTVANIKVSATDPSQLNYENLSTTTYYRAVVKNGICAEAYSGIAEVKVLSVVGGELSGARTVCEEGNSGTIYLQGYEGSILRWESSVDDFTTDITPIPHTAAAYSFSNLSTSTCYRAVVGNDGKCQEVASTVVKIVVEPKPEGGSLASSQSQVCSGDNSGVINLSGQTGTILRWESSTDNFTTDITPIANTSAIYTFSDLLLTTSYRVVVSNGDFCADQYSSVVIITVDPPSEGGVATGNITNVCSGENSGIISLSEQAGEVLRWESSIDNFESDITPIASTAPSLSFQDLLQTTSFRAVVKNGSCGEVFSTVAEVKVDAPSVGGSISGNTVVCAGSNSGTLSLSGHVGEVLRWESSTDNFINDITPIANTTAEYTFSNLSTPTSYRAVVGNGTCQEVISSVAHISFSPSSEGGTIVANTSNVCAGNNSGTLNLSAYQGNILRWEFSIDDFQSVTIINNTSPELSFQNLTVTTDYRAVVGDLNGCGLEAYSSVATIQVAEPAIAGEVSGAATVCANANAGTLTLVNYQGTIVRWESSTDGFSNHVVAVTETAAELSYSNLSQTTSYRAVLENAVCGEVYSAPAIIEVLESPAGGVLTGSKRIVAGNNTGTLVLEGYSGEILQWEVSGDNFATDIRIISHTQNQLDYLNLESNTWYRALIGSADCPPVYSQVAELTINQAPEAGSDLFLLPFGQSFSSDRSLLKNDSDPDGDQLNIEAVEGVITEKGNRVSLDADGYFYFEPVPGFSGLDSFSYQLCDLVQDATICTTGVVQLEVESDKKIIVYQGISPGNSDQKNDKWIIQNIQYYPDNLVQVYNRYGVLVFEMKGYNNTDRVFDGNSNKGTGVGDRQLPKDTYYYQIRLEEKSEGITGFVVISR